jgi:hypothetical protein
MYCNGLGLTVLGQFKDHDGFDGVMIGAPDAGYHFEFVRSTHHRVSPTPTVEDLLVFYIPAQDEWTRKCDAMIAAGFIEVESLNPYWSMRGRTFADHDGYRTVIECAEWRPSLPTHNPLSINQI